MPSLHEFAVGLVADGQFCTGLQLSRRGPELSDDIAIGGASPELSLSVDSLFSVSCATKPLLSLAIGLLADHGLVELDSQVSTLVGHDSPFRELACDLWSVLNHSAPLAAPDLFTVYLTPDGALASLIADGVSRRADGYSEFAASAVLAEIIQRVTGESAAHLIVGRMLSALGLLDDIRFGFTRTELALAEDRIGVYVVGLPDRALPLLHDRSPHQACVDRVLLGAYTSARGLMLLYSALGAVLDGEHVPGLPSADIVRSLLCHPGPTRWEHSFERTCSFSGGFMINLVEHGYGTEVGPDAFGHTGFLGRSIAFYDPRSRIAASMIINGLESQADFLAFRPQVINALLTFAS